MNEEKMIIVDTGMGTYTRHDPVTFKQVGHETPQDKWQSLTAFSSAVTWLTEEEFKTLVWDSLDETLKMHDGSYYTRMGSAVYRIYQDMSGADRWQVYRVKSLDGRGEWVGVWDDLPAAHAYLLENGDRLVIIASYTSERTVNVTPPQGIAFDTNATKMLENAMQSITWHSTGDLAAYDLAAAQGRHFTRRLTRKGLGILKDAADLAAMHDGDKLSDNKRYILKDLFIIHVKRQAYPDRRIYGGDYHRGDMGTLAAMGLVYLTAWGGAGRLTEAGLILARRLFGYHAASALQYEEATARYNHYLETDFRQLAARITEQYPVVSAGLKHTSYSGRRRPVLSLPDFLGVSAGLSKAIELDHRLNAETLTAFTAQLESLNFAREMLKTEFKTFESFLEETPLPTLD